MNTDESGPWEPACSGLPQQMVLTLCPNLYFVGGVRLRIVSDLGFYLVHDLHRLHRIVGETGKPQQIHIAHWLSISKLECGLLQSCSLKNYLMNGI